MNSTSTERRRPAREPLLRGLIVVLIAIALPAMILFFGDESDADARRGQKPVLDEQALRGPEGELLISLPTNVGKRLFVIPVDGSGQRPLLPEGAVEGDQIEGVWSPDGSQVAVTIQVDHSNDIYVVDASGSNLRQLAPASMERLPRDWVFSQHGPDWSPDGTTIAFSSNRAFDRGGQDIYTIAADGSDLRRLTDDEAWEFEPRWSPDGTSMLVEVYGGTRMRYGSLNIMNADGSDRRILSDATDAGNANWSPDGGWIAYTHGRFCCGVQMVRRDGTERLDLTGGGISGHRPQWSPDGSLLAWSAHDHGGSLDGLFVNDVRTGETRLVSSISGNLEWSPDGSWIAVAMAEIDIHGNPTGAGGLYLVRATGGRPELIQKIAVDDYDVNLDWRAASLP